MVFPVHAARYARLGRDGAADAGGCAVGGAGAEAADAGEPTGFFFVLDRSDGELLLATPIGKENWATDTARMGGLC